MKIVNPLYDHAFKYLMQNNRLAKKVIATLLGCEVLELVIEQQEIVTVHESRGLKLYRLDFSAVIVNALGKKQKVLIELQKSKLPTNLLRFRTYLGENYTKREAYVDAQGDERERAYPIISIYILGYNVVDIPYLAVSIDNKITNTVTEEEVEVKSDFIDLLTHTTKVIQIRRLSDKRQTNLERFLTIFNQTWVTKENYILDLKEIPEEFKDIVNHLGVPVHDDAFREKLRGEKEIEDIFKAQEAKLARKEAALEVANQQIIEERKLKEAAKEREQIAKERELATKYQFAQYLLKMNTPILEIIKMTGLSEQAIIALQNDKN